LIVQRFRLMGIYACFLMATLGLAIVGIAILRAAAAR
jgi:hypothetical protein